MQIEIHEARTETDGTFLVTGAWPHAFYILEADAEGDNRLTQPIDRTPGTGEIIDLGDIKLEELGVIIGRVVDEEGEGVPGVLVRAADVPSVVVDLAQVERFDPEGGLIIREGDKPFLVEMPNFVKRYFDLLSKPSARTDSKGRFRIAAVQPRENIMAFNKQGFVPLAKKGVRVASGKEKNVGEVKIREGEEVFVKVLDPEEEPVPGAEVMIGYTSLAFQVDYSLRAGDTDSKGEIYRTGFPGGRVTVAARRSKNHPWVINEPKNVASDIVVKLPGRYHFDVAIKSAVGKKIEAPRFKLLPSPDENMPLDAGMMGFVKWLDLKGKVELLEDGRYRISDLIPGKYTLAVSSAEHAAAKLDFKIDKSGEGELTLRPEAVFEVQVVNNLGKPVPRAKVYVLTRDVAGGRKLLETPIVAGSTDKAGKIKVKDGEAGTVRVSASHPAYGYAHAELQLPTSDLLVMRMDGPGEVAGILRENGRVPTPGKWTVVFEPRFRQRTRGAMPNMPKFTVPDLEGNFSAAGMQPGNYRVRVMKSLSALTSPGGIVGFAMRSRLLRDTVTKDLTIESGQTTFLDLEAIKEPEVVDGPSARVTGQVLVNGRPGKGMLVTGRGGRRAGVTADDAGRFDLGQVPVGDFVVQVRDPEQTEVMDFRMESHVWKRAVKIVANEDVVLNVEISTGSVEGVVRKANGDPAAGVRVRASGKAMEPGATAKSAVSLCMTDSRGRYQFERLASAAYLVEVQDRTGHGAVTADVRAGSRLRGIDISLASVHVVAGKVNLDVFGEAKPRWCYLQFERQGSEAGSQEGASVRRSGNFRARALPSGTYKVSLMVPGRGADGSRQVEMLEVAETIVVAGEDQKDVVLTPRPKPAEPEAVEPPQRKKK